MLGEMMRAPHTIGSLITHAEAFHSDAKIISMESRGERIGAKEGSGHAYLS